MRKNTSQKNPEYGHFSRCESLHTEKNSYGVKDLTPCTLKTKKNLYGIIRAGKFYVQ